MRFCTYGDPNTPAVLLIHGMLTPLIFYCHGTAVNELLSKRTANALKQRLPSLQIVPFKGDPHCFRAIYHPEDWYAVFRGTVF